MCGFVATVSPLAVPALAHRGPSGVGSIGALTLPWASVHLEMTRLAIVDRRPLAVPFDFRRSVGVVLAYNGEVYNWRSLRAELSDGTPWETDCDAEVIARAWRRWGLQGLHRLNGMFAFVLVDVVAGDVIAVRDRAGEKPLYYAPIGRGIAFASEIKALPVRFAEAPCPDLAVFEFDCLSETPFEGVRRLGPGEFIYLDSTEASNADGTFTARPQMWWSYAPTPDEGMSFSAAVDEATALITDAVRIRAVADVPVGLQASGGLDSAIVQAVAKVERCYTVTFPDDGVDNMPLARQAAAIAEPTPITFGMADLQAELPKIAYHLDTPATWTAVCQWFMARRMAADGCVVTLSGEGADELFGGYTRYRLLYWLEQARRDPLLAEYGYARQRLHGTDEEIIARQLNRSPGSPAAVARALSIVRRYAWGDLLTSAMRVDFYTTMQVLLRMADRMAAAFSMENRAVFFDHRLLTLSERLPAKFKVGASGSKLVLSAVARRLGVAPDVIDQPTKRGLFLPWANWQAASTAAAGPTERWERTGFAQLMLRTWRAAFNLA